MDLSQLQALLAGLPSPWGLIAGVVLTLAVQYLRNRNPAPKPGPTPTPDPQPAPEPIPLPSFPDRPILNGILEMIRMLLQSRIGPVTPFGTTVAPADLDPKAARKIAQAVMDAIGEG